jgi:hypothetical protein
MVRGITFVVEGEKCAAAIQALGLTAVTSQGGCKAAHKSDWSRLGGADDVVVMPDNDEPGEAYASDVLKCLSLLSTPPKKLRLLRLEGIPKKGDVVDWIQNLVPEWDGYMAIPESTAKGVRTKLIDLAATAKVADAAEPEWPQPVPLDTATLPRWPIEAFPEPLKAYIEAVAASSETPIELASMMTLAVIATASQRSYRIHVRHEHYEPLCIWACAALEPGNRKSNVLSNVTKPLYTWEKEQRDTLKGEIASAESRSKTAAERLSHLRRAAARASPTELEALEAEIFSVEADVSPAPKMPQIVAADCTPESLGTLMGDNGGAMAVLSDEGGIFDTLGGRYSNGVPNLDLWLGSHSGSSVRVNRGSREPVFIHSALLTVGLTPQPEVLQGLASKPGFRGRGLLARFLYVLPPSPVGYRTLRSEPIPPEIRKRYGSIVKRLLSLGGPQADCTEEQRALEMAPDALDLWIAFTHEIEPQLRDGGVLCAFKDWGAKLAGAVARIAANFHLVECADVELFTSTVSAKNVAGAVSVAEALVSHAAAVFAYMGADPATEDAKHVLRWIQRNGQTSFTLRDCHFHNKSRFSRVAEVEKALAVLSESHHVRERPRAPVAHRPSRVFDVNPAALAAMNK